LKRYSVGISRKNTVKDWEKDMAEYEKVKSKNVLLYGNGRILRENICWINMLYNVVGITGADVKKNCTEKKLYTKDDALKMQYDAIIVTTDFYDEIKEELISKYNIPEQKMIFYRDEFCEKKVQFGDKNPDVTFLVFRSTCQTKNNGFMNFYNSVVEMYYYAKEQGYELVVDLKNYYTLYSGIDRVGEKNVWEEFYQQPSGYSLDEVYKSKHVILCQWDTGKNILRDTWKDKIMVLAKFCGQNIKYSERFREYLDIETKKIRHKRVLGVLARGSSYFVIKPKNHPIPTETKIFIENVERMLKEQNYQYIYLATEDEEIFEQFKEKFGEKLLYTEQKRINVSEDDVSQLDDKWKWANTFYDKMYDIKNNNPALEYNLVIATLAQCDGFIANCMCGGAVGAIYQNGGKYELIDVNDNGNY